VFRGVVRRRTAARALAALAATALSIAGSAAAQFDDNPVYVDDSPHAWELFHQAADQARENPGESARIFQELLDRYPFKLVPRSDAERDLFDSVRARVHRALLAAPEVLERYRSIETPAAQRLVEEGRDEELLVSRFLTAPAVSAALRQAQREFEVGHFQNARALLEELQGHPDLGHQSAAYRLFYLALCANYLIDADGRQVALDALALGDDLSRELHAEATRLITSGPAPERQRGLSIVDRAPTAQPEVISGAPIWNVSLLTSLFSRRYQQDVEARGLAAGMEANRRTGELLTAAPTVAGQSVFINEGEVIRAFDRFSQREFWSREIGGGVPDIPRNANRIGDMNLIATSGDRLVTITGHAAEQERRGSARIVCLDSSNGDLMWSVTLERLFGSEEYEGLYPYGAPIIADGAVYVLARKSSRQVLMSTYLVALDFDGPSDNPQRVRWIRYIASTGGLQNSIMRPYSVLQYDSGQLIVATPVGAVAVVDALRGETQWLRRLPAPLSTTGTSPWEMSAPVVTAGEIFALTPDFGHVVVFDRRTGSETARYDAADWLGPRYLLAIDDVIYAIGGNISARLLSSPGEPLWALNESRDSGDGAPQPPQRRYDLRGRVQVAGDMLVVPTQDGVLFIDGHMRAIRREIPATGAGNPLCTGPELYLAQNDALVAYIPLSVAEANLREQIGAAPDNPQPALSLLRLAAKMDDVESSFGLALESADLVVRALARMSDQYERAAAQEELFDTLLNVARRERDLPYEKAIELYGRIGAIAIDPSQRIEHLLARGDYLLDAAERVDPAHLAAAIESYHAILAQPALASAERRGEEVVEPASAVATRKLEAVIRAHGDAAYAPYALQAQRALDELGAEPAADQLLAVARAYPFAPAARTAGRRAAEALAAEGDGRAAIAVLESLFRTSSPEEIAELTSAIVDLAIRNGWPELASAWIRFARDTHDITSVRLAGAQRAAEDLLREIDQSAARLERPAIERMLIGPETVPPILEGRLIARAPGSAAAPSALIVRGNDLSRYDVSIENPTWTGTVPAMSIELLQYWPGSYLFWLPDGGGEIMLVDEQSGEMRWASGEYRQSLLALRGNNARPRTMTLDIAGSGGRVNVSEVLALPSTEDVVVIGRTGGIARQRFSDPPDQFVWRLDHPLYGVHYAARHDLAIVLAGVRAAADGATTGVIALIDPTTGASMHEITPLDRTPPQWIAITRLGMLIFGTQGGIEAWDLATVERVWVNQSRQATGLARAWAFGENLFVADGLSRLHSIDVTTGALSAPFEAANTSDDPTFELIALHPVGDDALAHYRQRIVRYRPDGTVVCQDAVASQRDYTHIVPLAGGGALVVSHVPQVGSDPADRRIPRNAHYDWLYLLDDSCQILQQQAMDAERDYLQNVHVIDGWILLSQRQQTFAVPTR
jgi:outer membrane protein assembly factor BamB